jgi:transcriptional regulator with XRE-family HTH domain
MTDYDGGRTISEVVGSNVRRLRESKRWTQAEMADYLRVGGLPLVRSVIVSLEAGRRSIDIGEMIILATTLDVAVVDLIEGTGPVRLTASATADLGTVSQLLRGKARPDSVSIDTSTDSALQSLAIWSKAETRRVERNWPGAKPAEIVRAERSADDPAEQKAARKLGVRPFDVSMAAFRLWGESLTAHRNALVDDRSTDATPTRSIQAIRGRVTRDLLEQIRPLIPKGK